MKKVYLQFRLVRAILFLAASIFVLIAAFKGWFVIDIVIR